MGNRDSQPHQQTSHNQDFLAGGGEMGALVRAHDWAATPLGPIEGWPQSLRTAAQMVLASPFPNIVLWGPELVQIYNDGYRALMGIKHPAGLGQPTRECWPEVWHINAPIYERVLRGESLAFEDALYPITRSGILEDAWFTLSYSPIPDESGAAAGVLVTVFETTEWLRTEATLRESEETYRTLFSSIDEGLAVCEMIRDEDGNLTDFRYLDVNLAFETLTGLPVSTTVGRTVREILPPPFDDWVETYARVVETNTPVRFERYLEPFRRWLSVYCFPRGGLRFGALFSDITKRLRGETALRETEERQAFLLKLSDELRAQPDEEAIGALCTRRLAEHLQVDRCYFARFYPEEDRAFVGPEYRRPDLRPVTGDYRLSDFPEAVRRIQTETLVFDDVAGDPDLADADKQALAAIDFGAYVAPRVRKGDERVLWALAVASTAPRAWMRDEVALLEEVAERTWSAVEHARAEAALRASEERLARELADTQRLQEISTQLIQEGDVDALNQQLLDAAIAIMRSDAASMQMLDADRGELRLLAWKGFHPKSAAFWEWVHVDSGSSCGAALTTAQRSVVPDIETCDFMAGTPDLDAYRRSGLRAVQSTPLVARSGRLLGMISTHWREPHQPAERDLRLLDVLARQAADLIERRQAEAALRGAKVRFEAALEAGRAGIGVWDVSTNRVYVDGIFAEYFFLDPDQAQTGDVPVEDLFKAIHPEDLPRVEKIIDEASERPEGDRVECRIVKPDGTYRWVELRGRAEVNGVGKPVRFITVVIDITERKQIEQQKDALLGIASHELRTPLTTIKAYAQMLDRKGQSPTQTSRLLVEVGRLERLITELLDTSRIQQGRLELQPEPMDLAELAREVVERLIEVAESADRHQVVLAASEPVEGVWDAARLDQVLTNLLSNALKYSPEGGEVRLAVYQQADQAIVTVSDQGIGMTPEEQAHLFTPFQRGAQAQTVAGGIGLGLHIAAEIIKQHGGTIAVDSEPGKDTTFTVSLPR